MARTGTSVGMGITVGLCGVAAAGFLVSTIIFYGQADEAKKRLETYTKETQEIVQVSERNTEPVRLMIEEAKKSNKSLAGYVMEATATLGEKVSGGRGDSLASLTAKVSSRIGDGGGNILGMLSDRDKALAEATAKAASADSARTIAQTKQQEEAERFKKSEETRKKDTDALRAAIDDYKTKVDSARTDLDKARGNVQSQVTKVKEEADREKVQLNSELARTREELLVAQGKVRELSKARSKDAIKPQDEYALVDGEVIDLDPINARQVTISRGKKDKLILGMTFEVYSDPTQLRVNDRTGEYNPGKATLEVIRIDDSSATARVIRQGRSNSVAKGDVIANPVYDAAKTYSFLIFGDFDPSRTGNPSPAGQNDIRTLVEGWGGKISPALSGDVDFIVLGARPLIPPAPPTGAPANVVQSFTLAKRNAEEYDRLIAQAAATSIPVLNENRLYTLIGR